MLTIQPPFISEYFSATAVSMPTKYFRSSFLSWEDALWHLLTIYQIEHGATILLPEFYCGNVVEHMEQHHLKVRYYPVDQYLQTNQEIFVETIQKIKPAIVIIFHAVGINSLLMERVTDWIKYLDTETILLEDCVHKILTAKQISFCSDRHFLIDSLRKVVPIQGSNLYSAHPFPSIMAWQSWLTLPYRAQVFCYWMVMQMWLLLAYGTSTPQVAKWANCRAEVAMLYGYDAIGKMEFASPGIKIMNYLYARINIDKIEESKFAQAKIYNQELKPLLKGADYWLPTMEQKDYKSLRGFPLVMSLKVADRFLARLRAAGILVRFELNDSAWSQKQKIIYLPMGVHVSSQEIEGIVQTILMT